MYQNFNLDFNFEIEHEDVGNNSKENLYVVVKGSFDEYTYDYDFNVFDSMGSLKSINNLISILNPEIFKDIEKECVYKIESIIEEFLESKLNGIA